MDEHFEPPQPPDLPGELAPTQTYGSDTPDQQMLQVIYNQAYRRGRDMVEGIAIKEENATLKSDLRDTATTNDLLLKKTQELSELALMDSLTHLDNRNSLIIKMEQLMALRVPFGVLFIDLDNFKSANDKFGHQDGDEVLKGYAIKLKSLFHRASDAKARPYTEQELAEQSSDSIARQGGDEFVVVFSLNGARTEDEHRDHDPDSRLAREVAYVQQESKDYFKNIEPKYLRGLKLGASVGATKWLPSDGHISVETILARADKAMYAVKKNKSTEVERKG